MFIENRKLGNKKKYYLAHTYREGFQTKKIRVYLGLNLSDKELTEAKRNAIVKIAKRLETLKQIHDPYKTMLSGREIESLKSLEPTGKIKLMHLSERDWLKFTELFTYDTNAIEGSTIEKAEVLGILEENKWPDKSKEEISETFGVADAVKYIRGTKEHLSLELIKKLHKIVFKNSKPFAGNLRKPGEEVVVIDALGNVVHRGAPPTRVPYMLKGLVKWYNKNTNRYPPLILAAVVHNQFENIHPFRDGNGRVGRLLLINISLKHKLPPINIELKNRREYYSALQSYELDGNIRPMVTLILKEYKQLKSMLKKKG